MVRGIKPRDSNGVVQIAYYHTGVGTDTGFYDKWVGGALGSPTPLLNRLSKKWVGFHNTELGQDVRHAYHALAVDERRRPFKPANLQNALGDNLPQWKQDQSGRVWVYD